MPTNSKEYLNLYQKVGGNIHRPTRHRNRDLPPLTLIRIQRPKRKAVLYNEIFAIYPLPVECDISKFTENEKQRIASTWKYADSSLEEKIKFASKWGFTVYLDKLLNENAVDINKSAALYSAALNGRLETISYLVEQRNADINYYDSALLSDLPLNGAILSGDVNCVKYLLEKGASVEARGELTKNAIEQCIALISTIPATNCFTILKELIKAGASLDGDWPFFESTPRAYLEKIQNKKPKYAEQIAEILGAKNISVDAVDGELVASSDEGQRLKRHKPGR